MQTPKHLFFRCLWALVFLLCAWMPAHAQNTITSGDFKLQIVTSKLIYQPGETGSITVRLYNGTTATTGTLVIKEWSDLTSVRTLSTQSVSVPIWWQTGVTDGYVNFSIPYTAPSKMGGVAFDVSYAPTSGGGIRGTECSLVVDNALKWSHLSFNNMNLPQNIDDPANTSDWNYFVVQGVTNSRYQGYAGIQEQTFWAPDDFGLLAPPASQTWWRSGQGFYYVTRKALTGQLALAKAQGMLNFFYADKWACGPPAFDLARQHPDWFYWGADWYGNVWNTNELKKWADPTGGLNYASPPPTWYAITPIITKPEVEAYGLDQIKKSLQMFNWDGIRFDNYGWRVLPDITTDSFGNSMFPPGSNSDQLEANLVKDIKVAGQGVNPKFVYGDNGNGIGPGRNLATAPKKWLEECKGGGLVMEEDFGKSMAGRTMEDMRAELYEGARGTIASGGYPYVMGLHVVKSGENVSDRKALLACALASGVHICSGGVDAALQPYLKFSARYPELLYDASLQWIDTPELDSRFSLSTSSPVWWRQYVRKRTVASNRQQYIVHLVNPSSNTVFSSSGTTPTTKTGMVLAFNPPSGTLSTTAYALSGDGDLSAQPLVISVVNGNQLQVNLPALSTWETIVFDSATDGATPTATPIPTVTATSAPTPTPTLTTAPTATPVPMATPAPTATATPAPTATSTVPAVWFIGTGIGQTLTYGDNGRILAPLGGASVAGGGTISCQVETATDYDVWWRDANNNGQQEANEKGTDLDIVGYTWSATGGTFSSTTSQTPVWTAPTQAGTYTLKCTMDDLPKPIVPPDYNSRDDSPLVRTVTITVTATTATATPAPTATATPAPLVGQWSFDDAAHPLKNSVNNVDAIASGTLAYAPGYSGQALNLTGYPQAASVPGAEFLSATGAFTVECRVKFSGSTASQRLLGKWGTNFGEASYLLWGDGTGRPEWMISTGSGSQSVYSPTAMLPNQWYWLRASWDGSSTLKLWVNGALVAQRNDVPTINAPPNRDFVMGAAPLGVGHATALLDEVKVSRGSP